MGVRGEEERPPATGPCNEVSRCRGIEVTAKRRETVRHGDTVTRGHGGNTGGGEWARGGVGVNPEPEPETEPVIPDAVLSHFCHSGNYR